MAEAVRTVRRRQQTQSREEEILHVATTLFSERGYHNTSMEDIAQAVAIRKASLYYYFAAKDDILWRILEVSAERLVMAARGIAERDDLPPLRKLEELLAVHARHVELDQEQIIVFLSERRALNSDRGGRYLQWRRDYDAMFEQVIRDGQATGVFRAGDPRLIGFGILGMYNWLVQWYDPSGPLSVDDVHAQFLDVITHGLVAGPPDA